MRFDRPLGSTDRPPEPEPARPVACPFCESKAVGTLAKVITSATYWRCQACGEIWNPGRLETAARRSYRRAW